MEDLKIDAVHKESKTSNGKTYIIVTFLISFKNNKGNTVQLLHYQYFSNDVDIKNSKYGLTVESRWNKDKGSYYLSPAVTII